jgi:hypothetical protein
MERFNLNKVTEAEGKEQYHIKILNRFTALENLDDDSPEEFTDPGRSWLPNAGRCPAIQQLLGARGMSSGKF